MTLRVSLTGIPRTSTVRVSDVRDNQIKDIRRTTCLSRSSSDVGVVVVDTRLQKTGRKKDALDGESDIREHESRQSITSSPTDRQSRRDRGDSGGPAVCFAGEERGKRRRPLHFAAK